MNRLVAVVVLNWNGIEDTIRCIESLLHQTYKEFKIIIIDNHSTLDNSVITLKKIQNEQPDTVEVIYNTENKGFAGGVNTGIKHALERGFEYVALFNNDAFADHDWLSSLVNEMTENSSYGAVTGLLLHADGKTIDSTGDWCSVWGLPFPRNRGNSPDKAPVKELVFGATGGATLYKTALFKDVGLFDETFFAYFEDADISFRAQLRDWKIAYTPVAVAYHKQGATSSKIPGFTTYQTFKNWPLFFIKNIPTSLLLTVGVRFWFAYVIMLTHAIVRGNGGPAIKGWLKSISLFWTSALPARRKIQAGKKVSDNYIKGILWNDLPPDQTGLRKLRKLFTGKP